MSRQIIIVDSFSLTRRCVAFTQCTRRAIRPRSPLWPILITPTQLQIIKQPVTRVSISEEPSQTTRQRLVLNDCYHEISTILLTFFFFLQGCCPTTVLILVVHGGSVLDPQLEMSVRKSDVTTFRGAFESIVRTHYPSLVGHVVIKCVPCPGIGQQQNV